MLSSPRFPSTPMLRNSALLLPLALSSVCTTAHAAAEIVSMSNSFQQASVFGSAWAFDNVGAPTVLPTATGGTVNPDQTIGGGTTPWSASTWLQRTVQADGIDPFSGLPRPVIIDHVGANLTLTGTNNFATGVTPYERSANSYANATHGVLSASAQGLRQLGQTTGGAETMGVITSASSVITSSFALTIDRATALALDEYKPYLDLELTVQHRLIANDAFNSETYETPSLEVNLSAGGLDPTLDVDQSYTITELGSGVSVYTLRYELSDLLNIGGQTCLGAIGNPSLNWVPCIFSVGVDASINARSGAGSTEAFASLTWSVSDDFTRINTSAAAWGTPIPAVPEPTTVGLLLAGLGVVGMRTALKRRRGARPPAH